MNEKCLVSIFLHFLSDWQCKPRLKPLAFNDSTHDLPGFDIYSLGFNIIDWSSKGQIAASFDHLVLWGPPTGDKEKTTVLYKIDNIRALRYSPNGDQLALSIRKTNQSDLQIWQVSQKMAIFTCGTLSFPKKRPTEEIRTIEWDPMGQVIICGMSTGYVYFVAYPKMEKIHEITSHKAGISNIRYSIHRSYIAIVDMDGKLSIVRQRNYEVLHERDGVQFIAWHPWKENDLFLGYSTPVSICLFDVSTSNIISYYKRNDKRYALCAMTPNPLTAELVVSFVHKPNGKIRSDILVLASMNRVVDNLSAHQNSVFYLLWDPTGTHIATAGRDESLNIWNFFGKSQRKVEDLNKMQANKKVVKRNALDLQTAFLKSR